GAGHWAGEERAGGGRGEGRGGRPGERIVPAAADAAGEVRVGQRGDERRQIGRRALEVGVQRRDVVAPCRPEARKERTGLASGDVEAEHAEPGLARGERRADRWGLVEAAVVDHDELPRHAERIERGSHLVDEATEVRSLVTSGDDDAEDGAGLPERRVRGGRRDHGADESDRTTGMAFAGASYHAMPARGRLANASGPSRYKLERRRGLGSSEAPSG